MTVVHRHFNIKGFHLQIQMASPLQNERICHWACSPRRQPVAAMALWHGGPRCPLCHRPRHALAPPAHFICFHCLSTHSERWEDAPPASPSFPVWRVTRGMLLDVSESPSERAPPEGSDSKESACNARDPGLVPGPETPWGRDWKPTPVF